MQRHTIVVGIILAGMLGQLTVAHAQPEATATAPATAPYQTFASVEEAKAVCAQVVDEIGRGHVNEALDRLGAYWVLSDAEYDTLRLQIIKQMDLLQGRFGQPVGSAFVRQRVAANTAAELVFVERFEKHLLRWTFVLYNPGNTWLLNAISYDDDIDRLFE